MRKYQLFHPDTEMRGRVILDFERIAGRQQLAPILEKYGLTDLEPAAWYPAQRWLDVLNEVAAVEGASFNFVSMGIRQMELVDWPPEFAEMPLVDALRCIDAAYRENYRGPDIGSIKVEVVDEQHIKMIIRSFEPDDLWYGNMYGFMRLFAPKDHTFTVFFDEHIPRREEGGSTTIIHLTWE